MQNKDNTSRLYYLLGTKNRRTKIVKIKNKANKLNPEKHINIENIQKEILIKSLNKEYIIKNMQKERRIVVILDNYSVHKVKLVIQASEILN